MRFLFNKIDLPLQERRITPSEALNHPFVSMSHMADYAHCANVKSSARMMEICCKRGNTTNNQQQQHPPPLPAQLMVPRYDNIIFIIK